MKRYNVIINEGMESEISKEWDTKKECNGYIKSLRLKEYSQTLNNGIKIKTSVIRESK